MILTTKLETNQPVFFMFDNKVRKAEILEIQIRIDIHENVKTEYWIKEHPISTTYTTRFEENELFATKEELLKSL